MVQLPNFDRGAKVLDVGAGDGYMTQRLRDELGCDAFALEPSVGGYQECVKRLGKDHAFNLTLQKAVESDPENFVGKFDALTVFRYNIAVQSKEKFAEVLAQCLTPNGRLFITSVEEERIKFNSSAEGPYIIDSLGKYFGQVVVKDVSIKNCTYGVVECGEPRQELKWALNK